MFATRFDMRCPAWSPTSPPELYATAVELARFVDERALGSIVVSEHHGSPDGYLPSPLVLASAIAAVTERAPISVSALVVPLHDPLRLAEDVAVADLLSGGRLSLVVGLGYRREEYEMFGVPWAGRGQRLDRCLEVLLRAWAGEEVEWEGRRAVVRPQPAQRPHPLLFVGGSSPAAARRAARFGLGFFPTAGDAGLGAAYRAECERLGRAPGLVGEPRGPAMVHVAEDPDKAWAEVGAHLLHDAQMYDAWQPADQRTHVTHGAGGRIDSVAALREAGSYRIVTPEGCAAIVREHGMAILHPLIGGMPPEHAWTSLQLVADRVQPLLAG